MNSTPRFNFLQANVNHSTRSQDLLAQSMVEWECDITVISEPYYVPTLPHWAGDSLGSVAIVADPNSAFSLVVKERGPGYVVASWGEITIIGVYFSPNTSVAELEAYINLLGFVVGRYVGQQVLVMGDLNSKSTAWGSPVDDDKGDIVAEFVASLGLSVANRGHEWTCVRRNGGSIIDVTFATPTLASRISGWKVLKEEESLSDHPYITFEIATTTASRSSRGVARGGARFPGWARTEFNPDLAEEAAIVASWNHDSRDNNRPGSVNDRALRLRDDLTAICDAAMPRSRGPPPGKRAVYWWSAELASLRETCNRKRRDHKRCRRRRHTDDEEQLLYDAYKEAKRAFQIAIAEAKSRAREEWLQDLDRDPWGRPFLVVRSKMRSGAPRMEDFQPQQLQDVVSGLFPERPAFVPPVMAAPTGDQEEVVERVAPVTQEELDEALHKLRGKRKKAPGPDGIPGFVLLVASKHLGDQLRELFSSCMESGEFPSSWKTGRLCLLKKAGRSSDSPSAFRPIVLLDEVSKLFERLLAARIVQHLSTAGPDLSDQQFGFRAGKSTVDAVQELKDICEMASSKGEKVLAVSLDIANAFNTIPFESILEGLRFHEVPMYLQKLVANYLAGRQVKFVGPGGVMFSRGVSCGVPQGSVLGPLLWNIGFNWVLRGLLLPRMNIICYADDTLVVSRGRSYAEVARLATVGTTLVVERIRMLGLEVALSKTEAIYFHGPRDGPPVDAHISVNGFSVPVGKTMRYLGLTLDSRWGFEQHFTKLAPKLVATALALGRLLPNIGGPKSSCRRLYTTVVRSMALYGAPIWVEAMNPKIRALLRSPQRAMAMRAVRAYRTVAASAALVLAGTPPWEMEAEVLDIVYKHKVEQRARGERLTIEEMERIRQDAHDVVMERWAEDLETAEFGRRTVDAIRPVLQQWVERKHGFLTYRLVQVLTGHGCFGDYLHRIKREVSPVCHECGAAQDSAQHTLEECDAWSRQRRSLVAEVGRDLSLPSVVKAMLDSDRSWEAMVSFCEEVISQKETAERFREGDAQADAIRRRRPGGRRRQFASQLAL